MIRAPPYPLRPHVVKSYTEISQEGVQEMTISKNRLIGSALAAAIGLGVSAPALASPLTRIANSVADLTTSATLYTVPAGDVLLVRSVVIAGSGLTADSCCARLFRNGVSGATGFIAVQQGDSVTVNFSPGIQYSAGQTLQVRNGASSGPISFTVHGDVN